MNRSAISSSAEKKPPLFYGYVVVATASTIMAVIHGAYAAFGVFFKPVLNEFGWTAATTSGAFSLSMLLFGLLGIVMGGLTDRFGPRMVLTLCGFLLGLGYLLMSQTSQVWQLYLFYGVIIGTGMGGSWVTPVATVARWFARRRALMSGIVLAGLSIGTLIAPPVANWLIAVYDWRISFLILGIAVFVIVVVAAQFLKRDPAQMGLVPYGDESRGGQGLKLDRALSLQEAIHTRQFWMVAAMNLCFGFSVFTVMVHLVPHAIELQISATTAANILATIGGVSVIGRLALGSAADRIGNRRVYLIGFTLTTAAFFWLVSAREAWSLFLFSSLFGLAHGGMGAATSPLIARLFGLGSHGLILGVATFGYTIGASIGPFLAGYIFDVTGSYQMAFQITAALSLAGLVLTILLRPIRKGDGESKTIPL